MICNLIKCLFELKDVCVCKIDIGLDIYNLTIYMIFEA